MRTKMHEDLENLIASLLILHLGAALNSNSKEKTDNFCGVNQQLQFYSLFPYCLNHVLVLVEEGINLLTVITLKIVNV